VAGQAAGGHHLLDGGGQGPGQDRALGHVADPPSVLELFGRGAEEADGAGLGPGQTEEDAQQRRLPRAVGADEGHELALAHPEADPAQDRVAAVRERDVARLEHRVAGGGVHRDLVVFGVERGVQRSASPPAARRRN
jgi:hypothetical protein